MNDQLAEYTSSHGRQDEREDSGCFDLVDEAFGCPVCGNCIMDKLVWSSDYEHITCSCGITYTLKEA